MKRIIPFNTLLIVFLLAPQFLLAKEPDNDEILFHIIRSRDADKIFYMVNLDKDGNLIASDPVKIFWVKQTQGNQKEPLTWIQNKHGYGLQYLEVDQQHAVFRFVSFQKTFILKKDESESFRVFTTCGEREMIVNSLFVQFKNDSFWFPKIKRVELHATESGTESMIVEYIDF
jgi:hypothetical protein